MSGKDNKQKVAEVEYAEYQLQRNFLDGARKHPRGAVLRFEKGKAPRTAIELSPEEAKRKKGDHVGAGLDPVKVQVAAMQAQIDALQAEKEEAEVAKVEASAAPAAKVLPATTSK